MSSSCRTAMIVSIICVVLIKSGLGVTARTSTVIAYSSFANAPRPNITMNISPSSPSPTITMTRISPSSPSPTITMTRISPSSPSPTKYDTHTMGISPTRTSVVTATTSVLPMRPRVTCQENHMEIELDKNTYSYLNSSAFHLRDSSCHGQVTQRSIILSTPLNSCMTISKQTDDTVTYQNEVRAEWTIKTNPNDTVTRHDALVLPFNCTYKRRKYVSVSFKPKRRVDAEEGAFGNFTFLMDLYSDNSYTHSYNISDYPISVQLNQRLYIKYQVLSDKADLHVFAEKCLATTTTSESTTPSYVFLDNGCNVDKTINYNYEPNREQNFSIQAFRFIANHPVVYLHCLLLVCHTTYNTSKCAVGCQNNRVRRDMSRDAQESNLYHLSSGPITLKRTIKSTPDKTTTPGVTVIALSSAVGMLLIGCFVLLVLLRRRKKQTSKTQDESQPTQLEAYDNPGVNREDDPAGLKMSNQQDDAL
ncbi:ZP domain-containing protein-like isoform X3 [Actinia tenebrosa]|uniref:ZP domain-containing protein-like isoform X3 n=1 Tax=Actinia tenebrosa TaxID=6105 RepID=A0A6P8HE40_ACTTE|nr:ZP domain-containing protein-like isoform X3 [Actinia tenebrosa]